MRKFILGVIFTILVLLIGGLGLALLGFFPTNANTAPPRMESNLAMSALDASVERHAPHLNNPVPPTDDSLTEGLKIYAMNCAGCHGGLDQKPVELGHSFYPPAPNLIQHPPDDPEWRTYYVIHNGVRYTGMPAWDKVLSEPDMWKVAAFLSRMEKLPPAVQDYWKKTTGVNPPSEGEHGERHK